MEWSLNLRSDGVTRGKRSIIGWEHRGEGCGYLRLQGGTRLCWLRTIRSLMIIVVGRYPTIPLEMSIGIVYEPPMNSLACGIAWKMCTRERWDPDKPYDVVVKECHMWSVRGHTYVVLVRFIPCRAGYWFRYLWHSWIWVIACSLPPLIEMHA
jgi:hypothetical protein